MPTVAFRGADTAMAAGMDMPATASDTAVVDMVTRAVDTATEAVVSEVHIRIASGLAEEVTDATISAVAGSGPVEDVVFHFRLVSVSVGGFSKTIIAKGAGIRNHRIPAPPHLLLGQDRSC